MGLFIMNRTEKQQTVGSLGEDFRSISSAFLINYRGLKVVDATELRRKIREINGRYVVVKNTLAMRAAKNTKLEPLGPYFEGPTAVAYHPKDVVGLAKLLSIGNKADLCETDLLECLAADKQTHVIAAYLESIAEGPEFIRIAERVSAKKPVVAISRPSSS